MFQTMVEASFMCTTRHMRAFAQPIAAKPLTWPVAHLLMIPYSRQLLQSYNLTRLAQLALRSVKFFASPFAVPCMLQNRF